MPGLSRARRTCGAAEANRFCDRVGAIPVVLRTLFADTGRDVEHERPPPIAAISWRTAALSVCGRKSQQQFGGGSHTRCTGRPSWLVVEQPVPDRRSTSCYRTMARGHDRSSPQRPCWPRFAREYRPDVIRAVTDLETNSESSCQLVTTSPNLETSRIFLSGRDQPAGTVRDGKGVT